MMETSQQSRKSVRTRAKKNATLEEDTRKEMPVCSTSVSSMAPTAQLAVERRTSELDVCRMRIEWQQEKINELTKERDYLKEQLASSLRKDYPGSTQPGRVSDTLSDSSVESPTDSTSDSSQRSSSDSDEKKKRRNKKGIEKKYRRKSKGKKEPKAFQRAQTPDQVVARYKKILKQFSRGGTMSNAFKRVGVDRNTVVTNAPIAELYIAAPGRYKELMKDFNIQVKLSVFARQCAAAIEEDPAICQTVKAYKASTKLLPLRKKN
ncbi:coiled-coil domain-containing protein 106-like [Notolabrus celidotus]|uniref:coiled-coil domain-containing protein 106-like n=1 Tax=Notolabrus celidotus TaxID=1203425 RepID=UPI0014901A2C|nr:coiled-coil domain-containing protein 106-like [Notolabrus celidotus]